MPAKRDHIQQADSNQDFYRELNQNGIEYFDWKVTILFYTVLHLVDALAADSGHLNFADHRSREQVIHGLIGRNEFNLYRQLKNASRATRYDAQYFGANARSYWQSIHKNVYYPLQTYLRAQI